MSRRTLPLTAALASLAAILVAATAGASAPPDSPAPPASKPAGSTPATPEQAATAAAIAVDEVLIAAGYGEGVPTPDRPDLLALSPDDITGEEGFNECHTDLAGLVADDGSFVNQVAASYTGDRWLTDTADTSPEGSDRATIEVGVVTFDAGAVADIDAIVTAFGDEEHRACAEQLILDNVPDDADDLETSVTASDDLGVGDASSSFTFTASDETGFESYEFLVAKVSNTLVIVNYERYADDTDADLGQAALDAAVAAITG